MRRRSGQKVVCFYEAWLFVFMKHGDALGTLYFRGVGRNTSRHVRIWHGQKKMIGRTDWYLVILSSNAYVFEDKLTRCGSV